jgi:hypothetical protein
VRGFRLTIESCWAKGFEGLYRAGGLKGLGEREHQTPPLLRGRQPELPEPYTLHSTLYTLHPTP